MLDDKGDRSGIQSDLTEFYMAYHNFQTKYPNIIDIDSDNLKETHDLI